mmetsp:Transcript_13485/g.24241  ORF Transcript_13485/g.24241 Transcript_13485/m.24241 type:complete len:205 (-) Transcript_13485:306-920(-)
MDSRKYCSLPSMSSPSPSPAEGNSSDCALLLTRFWQCSSSSVGLPSSCNCRRCLSSTERNTDLGTRPLRCTSSRLKRRSKSTELPKPRVWSETQNSSNNKQGFNMSKAFDRFPQSLFSCKAKRSVTSAGRPAPPEADVAGPKLGLEITWRKWLRSMRPAAGPCELPAHTKPKTRSICPSVRLGLNPRKKVRRSSLPTQPCSVTP